jgi:hypothetical protein
VRGDLQLADHLAHPFVLRDKGRISSRPAGVVSLDAEAKKFLTLSSGQGGPPPTDTRTTRPLPAAKAWLNVA